MGRFAQFSAKPVRFEYPTATGGVIADLQHKATPVVLRSSPTLILANEYYQKGLEGTRPQMFGRKSVANRIAALQETAAADGYGICVFDAFRSKITQLAIFNRICAGLQSVHPDWTTDRLRAETVRFAAHPELSNYPVLPHNSGGAIDLTLTKSGIPLDMGTGFDEPILASALVFFERDYDSALSISRTRWEEIRTNRRILFHAMASLGFTSNQKEWWHYDLGNCLWARTHGIEWYYPSMEDKVVLLCASL